MVSVANRLVLCLLVLAACGVPQEIGAPVGPDEVESARGEEPDEPFPEGDTTILVSEGEGWRLVEVERGAGQTFWATIATSPEGLDRMWELGRFRSRKPSVDFDTQVLLTLVPAVSGSCPDIVFEGLRITPELVHGVFRYPRTAQVCTADANPVAFFVIAERDALPQSFTLAVEESDVCLGCSEDTVAIDLAREQELEEELWGTSRLALRVGGTAPPPGAYNVVGWRVEMENALLFSASEWTPEPRWFQSFGSDYLPEIIEGNVATCELERCEECLGEECDRLKPLGPVCSQSYEPVPFEDLTMTIWFDGETCEIEVTEGFHTGAG